MLSGSAHGREHTIRQSHHQDKHNPQEISQPYIVFKGQPSSWPFGTQFC